MQQHGHISKQFSHAGLNVIDTVSFYLLRHFTNSKLESHLRTNELRLAGNFTRFFRSNSHCTFYALGMLFKQINLQ